MTLGENMGRLGSWRSTPLCAVFRLIGGEKNRMGSTPSNFANGLELRRRGAARRAASARSLLGSTLLESTVGLQRRGRGNSLLEIRKLNWYLRGGSF